MVSASLAVQWWDQWQLRVLVLGSLCIQYLLFVAAAFRKYCTRAWFRSLIWLAYLGSDAITVYALAILFSLHKKVEWATAHPGSIGLDVLWSAILLLHLGGRDDIVAYSLEDNQLWKRHLLTAVSQVSERAFFFFAQSITSSFLGHQTCSPPCHGLSRRLPRTHRQGSARSLRPPWISALASASAVEKRCGVEK
ncbi:hypothetical protein HU200_049063 [Digitaria exilis]|uniref:DUF4220 domain-containing protein n=1 Tax=Digitaria exilis TaxID=1010633 RepID=A0A835AUD1_9POAL|nr:hypothetical protein HU200_049063 [Digitaria exilis]